MIAIVAVIVVLAAVDGARRMMASRRWFDGLHHPGGTPAVPTLAAVWAVAHALLAVGLVIGADGGFVVGLAAATAAGGWLAAFALFGRESVRNGFFAVCVAWVPAALTALAVGVRSPLAGTFAAIPAIVLTVGVVWSFVLWQINEPTRYH